MGENTTLCLHLIYRNELEDTVNHFVLSTIYNFEAISSNYEQRSIDREAVASAAEHCPENDLEYSPRFSADL
jgi:hypothetical protein